MTDREKVIKGLECCEAKPLPKCEACPYADADEGTCFTMDKMHIDALALLKAQEARVMTLEEAKSAFVVEYRSGKMKEVGASLLDISVDPANDYYGEIYRVWTSRPSEAEREATPWKT